MRYHLLLIVALAVGGSPGCQSQLRGPADRFEPADMRGGPAADTVQEGELDLRLDVLAERRPARVVSRRNPFRFGRTETVRVPLVPGRVGGAARETRPAAGQRPRLRFIGVVNAPRSAGLIAVLADGADVFQGRVGDTVDGRYRITGIARDTVEIERLISGGREVLRLDGLR